MMGREVFEQSRLPQIDGWAFVAEETQLASAGEKQRIVFDLVLKKKKQINVRYSAC
jgi:hypothetical protein